MSIKHDLFDKDGQTIKKKLTILIYLKYLFLWKKKDAFVDSRLSIDH
jgi:hypothetical protein